MCIRDSGTDAGSIRTAETADSPTTPAKPDTHMPFGQRYVHWMQRHMAGARERGGKVRPSMPVLHAISLSFPAPSAFVIRAERRRASDLRPFHYKIPHIPPASRSRVLHIIEKDPAQRLRPDTGHAYGCFTAMPHTSDAAMVVFPLFVRFFDTFFALLSCFFICK